MKLSFSPVSSDPGWGNGLGAGPQMGSVPRVFFPMRHGCRIHLYNDAYQAGLCWHIPLSWLSCLDVSSWRLARAHSLSDTVSHVG